MRVLVLAPSGRDAALVCKLLEKAGMPAATCSNVQQICAEMENGAGALVIAEEALTSSLIADLSDLLKAQEPWSDFPLVLLTAPGEVSRGSERRRQDRKPLGNVLLLERPVRPETMLSTVAIALRARDRQYQVRDYIRQQRRIEESLRKSEKLAVAGRLAASIAHEINNPLEAIGNLLYIIGISESIPEVREYLSLTQEQLARVSEIVKQTLRFHRETTHPAPVALGEVVDSVLALYAGRLRSAGIHVTSRFRPVAPIHGFAGELRQLVANLVGNAVDAMRFGGTLQIRIRECRMNGKSGVRLTVSDSGSGIPSTVRSTLFEPFVSTKENTGTGLGLWVSGQIVQRHSGTIRVKSKERVGTTFSVFLSGIRENVAAAD
jgi:signal transduction histidine kinase